MSLINDSWVVSGIKLLSVWVFSVPNGGHFNRFLTLKLPLWACISRVLLAVISVCNRFYFNETFIFLKKKSNIFFKKWDTNMNYYNCGAHKPFLRTFRESLIAKKSTKKLHFFMVAIKTQIFCVLGPQIVIFQMATGLIGTAETFVRRPNVQSLQRTKDILVQWILPAFSKCCFSNLSINTTKALVLWQLAFFKKASVHFFI